MKLDHWRVLITRPETEAQALASRLAQHQVFTQSLPLLGIEPRVMGEAEQQMLHNLASYDLIIVVSKPAARLVSPWVSKASANAWFTVGAATAKVLAAAGVVAQYPTVGDDSEALLALPAFAQVLVTARKALIVRGTEGREHLAKTLASRGLEVEYLALYERYLPTYRPGTLAAMVKSQALNGLVVSSAQGLENLHQLAQNHWRWLAHMPLFVPSIRVAELARSKGATYVINCQGAGADALIKALAAHMPACAE